MSSKRDELLTGCFITFCQAHRRWGETNAAVNGNLDPTLSKARQAIDAASTPNLHLEKTATKWIFAVFYKGRCESLPYFLANLVNLCRTCFWMRWILSVYQVSKSETASNKKNPYGERSSSSLSYSDRSSICRPSRISPGARGDVNIVQSNLLIATAQGKHKRWPLWTGGRIGQVWDRRKNIPYLYMYTCMLHTVYMYKYQLIMKCSAKQKLDWNGGKKKKSSDASVT